MKGKPFVIVIVVLLSLLLVGCELKGYCEDDGLYYFIDDNGVLQSMTKKECGSQCQEAFGRLLWCPYVEPEPTPVPAKPLFPMQLLEIYDPPEGWLPYCMVMTEGGVSIERQQAICGWVADNHTCGGMVYDDDTWTCDWYGYYRQPLPVLKCLWQRHLDGTRDPESFAKCQALAP